MVLEREAWKSGYALSEGILSLPFEGSYRLYAPRRPPKGKARLPLLVCLHRYGGDPDRFARIVPWLGMPGWAFVFVRGPFRVPTPTGQVQRAWAVSTPQDTDPAGREFSLALVAKAVREVAQELPVSPASTFLVGHSQGGYLALHGLLRHPALFAGAAALGAQMNADLARADLAGARGKHVLLVHGEEDDLIPVDRAETACSILSEGEAQVELWRYPEVGHWPTRQMYREAGTWLRSRLSRRAAAPPE